MIDFDMMLTKVVINHVGYNGKQTIIFLMKDPKDKIFMGVTNEHGDGTGFDKSEIQQIYKMLDNNKNLFLHDKIRVRLDRGKDIHGEQLPEVNGEFDEDAQWMEVVTHEIFHTNNLPVGAHIRLVSDHSFEGRVLKD